jgi:hypothetical protein
VNLIKYKQVGNCVTKEEDNPVKKLTFQKPFGSRRKGRLKLRWIDDIEADLKTQGVRWWRRKALDSDE